MTDRRHTELRRLFLPRPAADAGADAGTALIERHRARAMVLELARPDDWDQRSTVWRGVQTDLELPAPAFAVTGSYRQAGVLSTLASIPPSAFDAALERLDARVTATPPSAIDLPPALPAAATTRLAPRQFLLQIMNDDSVALALRIEAAKALLPYFELGTNPQDRSP